MKVIEKENDYYFVRINSVLITDSKGKIKLKQTSENLEEEIRHLLGEDVEIKIKRIK